MAIQVDTQILIEARSILVHSKIWSETKDDYYDVINRHF